MDMFFINFFAFGPAAAESSGFHGLEDAIIALDMF